MQLAGAEQGGRVVTRRAWVEGAPRDAQVLQVVRGPRPSSEREPAVRGGGPSSACWAEGWPAARGAEQRATGRLISGWAEYSTLLQPPESQAQRVRAASLHRRHCGLAGPGKMSQGRRVTQLGRGSWTWRATWREKSNAAHRARHQRKHRPLSPGLEQITVAFGRRFRHSSGSVVLA